MPPEINWPEAIKALLKKYKNQKHPLEYKNTYQLLVMVILSARDSDRHINQIAPELFKAFPTMKALSLAAPEDLSPYLESVRGGTNKIKWLIETAQQIKEDKLIPLSLEKLTELPGIGRKSANVIKREAKAPAEGIIVDLHVVRVAPRLGIASGTDPKKIERQLMEVLPKNEWDAGMALSFLGREICRPKPQCAVCLMNPVCSYYNGWGK